MKNSNPFCPVTPNKTGWDLWTKTRWVGRTHSRHIDVTAPYHVVCWCVGVWLLYLHCRRDEPMIRDHRHDAIGGTDPNPPIMPKYK